MTSMVPEVSLLFGEDSGMFVNPKKPTITQGKPNGVAHTSDFRPKLPVLHEQPNVQQSKSASGFSAQQNQEKIYQQTNVQNGRLAQHYMNSVPKSGFTTDSVPQNRTSYQDSVPQNRTSNSNPMFHNRISQQNFMPQNRPSHQETAFQSGPSNPNYMYQTSTSSQNNVPNMTNNRQVYTGTIQGHQQLVQPYPQYVPNNHPSVPYSYGQSIQQHGYTPMPSTQGFIGQPQLPPQHFTTQYTQQAPANYVPGYDRPPAANHCQPNQQGMIKNSQQQFVPITPQNQQITVSSSNSVQRNVHQDQRPSPHADSSKSSDDSGLSITPEKQMPPPKPNNKNPETEETPDSILHSKNINWNQVPQEVYQLLVQQDAQLKKLQSQIQMLITNQSNSSQNTTTTELDSKMSSVNKPTQDSRAEMCSVAVNTSMFYPQQSNQSVSQQTSPQKSVSIRSDTSSGENTPRQGSQCSGDDGRTPAEIRHRGILPFNSTHKDEFDLDASQDLSSVVNNMALHDKTIDSIQSDMIVDMPSYHSSPTRYVRIFHLTGTGQKSPRHKPL